MKSLCFFLISLSTLFNISNARKLNVGGSGAWVPNPPENYQTWSGRNRFLIHDTLYFSYAKGADSVLEVNKADFDGCNTKNPMKRVDDGESQISLDRYGPFYFISGNEDNCKKGQKLAVVVISAKTPSTAQPPHAASPGGAPMTSPPGSMAPKSGSPVSPTTSPPTPPNSFSPSSAPMSSPPAPMAPKSSSTIPPSSAPVTSPPGPMAPESPSPVSMAPEVSSSSSPPSDSPSGSAMGPSGDGPSASGDITTPAGAPEDKKSSSNGLAVMSIPTIVFSLVLTIFMSA